MVHTSKRLIIEKIKECRGITLDINPTSLFEIMYVFEQVQNTKFNGIDIANKLIDETFLFLRIIDNMEGYESTAFKECSDIIASQSLELIDYHFGCVCENAFKDYLQPDLRNILSSRVIDLLNVLDKVAEFYMTPATRSIYTLMATEIVVAQECLKAFVPSF